MDAARRIKKPLEDFRITGHQGLEKAQREAAKLLKATLQISPRERFGKSIRCVQRKDKPALGYSDRFEQAFQQNSGIKELTDETVNSFKSLFVPGLMKSWALSLNSMTLMGSRTSSCDSFIGKPFGQSPGLVPREGPPSSWPFSCNS